MKHLQHIGLALVALFALVMRSHAGTKGGDVDLSFNPGSSVNGSVNSLVVLTNGKVVIGGNFTLVHGALRGQVARLNADGTTDVTFMNGLSGADGGGVNAMALQPDGKLVIVGAFGSVNGVLRNNIARQNPDGSLDASFQNGMSGSVGEIASVAIQPDGRVLIGGNFNQVNGVTRYGIARLNSDGSLDTSFQNGMAGIFSATRYSIFSMAVQPDGKVLIRGEFNSVNGVDSDGFSRLNADGSLDAGFQNAMNHVKSAGLNGGIEAFTLQTNGQLVVGGIFDTINGVTRNKIARLNADGSLDTSFQNAMSGVNFAVHSIVLQSDGKVFISGDFNSVNGIARTNLARLNLDGSLDTSFQGALSTVNVTPDSLAVQPDGKLLLGGFAGSLNHVARLNANGSADASFFRPPPGVNGTVNSVSLLSGGKVLIAGAFDHVDGPNYSGIARLNSDGSLDATFSGWSGGEVDSVALQPDGKVLALAPFIGIARLKANGGLDSSFVVPTITAGQIVAFALQPDGKVLIGGSFYFVNGNVRNGIARLNSNGSLDGSFQNGMDGVGDNSDNHNISAIALQTDGKVVVGGNFVSINGDVRNGIARLNSDGSLDGSFQNGMGGVSGGFNSSVANVIVQPDNKVLINGNFTSINDQSRTNLARLNADGSLDMSFQEVGGSIPGYVSAFLLQSDGKVFIGGVFNSVAGMARTNLARLNSNGSVDASFEDDMPGVGDSAGAVNAIAMQSNGELIIGGYFLTVNEVVLPNVARLYGTIPGLEDPGIMTNWFGFNLTGLSNQIVVVEASTNLLDWTPLKTNTLGANPLLFSDPASPNFPSRFYRARLQ